MARKKTRQKANNKAVATDTEWAILNAVYANPGITAPEVHEQLHKQRGWTYSTVKTMMDRLVKKKVLKTKKLRNIFLYNPVKQEDTIKKEEAKRFINRVFDGDKKKALEFIKKA